MHPGFNHSFSSTSYSLSATIAARLLKNVTPSTISWPKYSAILSGIKEYQQALASNVKSDVIKENLDYYYKPITDTKGAELHYTDKYGDYTFTVNSDYYEWYMHLIPFKQEEAKKAMAYLSRKSILDEPLLIDNNKLKHSTLKLYCKAFVKVEIAMRMASKPIRPRMIQFLPPTFMVNLAPHAYLCYKILKKHTTNPQRLYVNSSGTTYADLSKQVMEAIVKVQNATGNNLEQLCTLFFNGDDSLLIMNKALFLSSTWRDGSTIWGRDPVTHRKTSIYLGTYCSGWFVRYFDGTKHIPFFQPRPFKALSKFSFVIASQAINDCKNEKEAYKLFVELVEAKALSMYHAFQLDPFMSEIALAWLEKCDSPWYLKLLAHHKGEANNELKKLKNDLEVYTKELSSKYTYQDKVRFDVENNYKNKPESLLPIYGFESVWWSYAVNYSTDKSTLIDLRDTLIRKIKTIPFMEYEFYDNDLLAELIQTDLDAKNPCATHKDVWFDNEGDAGIYEVDCSAYDSTTQKESLLHNMWFQRQCFGDTLFIDAIGLRKKMKVQSMSPFQTASWFTLYQMLSGYYDTSIGNGICNCTEITTSLLLSFPQCVLRFE